MNDNKVRKVFSKYSVLESRRLILRPFSLNDTEDVFEYTSDKRVTRFLTWEPLKHPEQAEKVVKELIRGRTGAYAIELKSENKCIGCIELRVDSELRKASIGYILNRRY